MSTYYAKGCLRLDAPVRTDSFRKRFGIAENYR